MENWFTASFIAGRPMLMCIKLSAEGKDMEAVISSHAVILEDLRPNVDIVVKA
jgi:hypothetical protein